MDKDRSNHVGLPLFLEGCKALGYEDEEEANFSVFLPISDVSSRGALFISIRTFDKCFHDWGFELSHAFEG